jgi:hypothetical protein
VKKLTIDNAELLKYKHISATIYKGNSAIVTRSLYEYLVKNFKEGTPIPLYNTNVRLKIEKVNVIIGKDPLQDDPDFEVNVKGEIIE